MTGNSDSINQIPLNPPINNLDKPFFAYGIFKEGQIAHSKIKHCIKDVKKDNIYIENRMLNIRDGVPVIFDKKNNGVITRGHLITFNDKDKEEAYKIISDTEPKKLYKWVVDIVDGQEVNVLFGRPKDKGASRYDDDEYEYIDSYDGRMDPLFGDLLVFLDEEYNSLTGEDNDIFRLQMYYMILWSAIQRYCHMKYNSVNFDAQNNRDLAHDDVFIKSLNETKIRVGRVIFSTKNVRPYKLNYDPERAINYYYTVRNNVVHRGKDKKVRESDLSSSFKELLEIFGKVIDKTFTEEI